MAQRRTTSAQHQRDAPPVRVASNEYAYVQDLTKGDIVLYVGPTKISLSNTERLVEYKNDRFLPVAASDPSLGVSPFVAASSSQYVIVENPPKDTALKATKRSNASVELLNGRKALAARLTESLGPLAILGGESVVEVAERLLGALPVGSASGLRALWAGDTVAPPSPPTRPGPNGRAP